MLESLGGVLNRIAAIESFARQFQSPMPTEPQQPATLSSTTSSTSEARDGAAVKPMTFAATLRAQSTGGEAPAVQHKPKIASLPAPRLDSLSDASTAAPDPRWTDILGRDQAYIDAGAHGPTNSSTLNPLYAGTYSADVEARRRSDGSLNPIDLPSSLNLTPDQLKTARLAESVPNDVLFSGQNEGVARPGQPQNQNDSYDLLGWVQQLKDMQAGKIPAFVQDNGYTWTQTDIATNLSVALDQVALNKQLWNDRWQSRWAMLRDNGQGDIADQERASVTLVDPSELKLTGPEFPGQTSVSG